MKNTWIISVLFITVFSLPLKGQEIALDIILSGENSSFRQLNEIQKKQKFNSINELNRHLQSVLIALYEKGYIASSFDSIVSDSLSSMAYLHTDKQYQWAELDFGKVDAKWLSAIGYREKYFQNQLFNYKQVALLMENLLVYCENNGYPFATVGLRDIKFRGDSIAARLHLEKNQQIIIDSVVVNKNAPVHNIYMQNYLNIRPGDLYNEKIFRQVGTRLKEIPFLKEKDPAKVIFRGNDASVYLFVTEKNASRFNGILGFLPDETRKLVVTGEVELRLQNAFKRGELIAVNWERLRPRTQQFNAEFNYPFLLQTPFGIELSLDHFKRDTLFTDLRKNAGIQYLLKGGSVFNAFVNFRSSSLLSTAALKNTTVLPPYADINITSYGIGYKIVKVDYRVNPRKGIALQILGGMGNKTINKNPALPEFVYDSLELKTLQMNASTDIKGYIPLFRQSTLHLRLQGGYLNNEKIFGNELFRIGGLKTLRGFDEEVLLASAFAISTVEFRYLLEQNSYAHIFWDGAFYENKSGSYFSDTPFGFGAGISFETKAGIFSLNYALGKQQNNPILIKSGKIHFGFVNYF